jgi:hypothetical protein
VLRVIGNGVKWVAFNGNDTVKPFYGAMCEPPLETISPKDYESAIIDHEAARRNA